MYAHFPARLVAASSAALVLAAPALAQDATTFGRWAPRPHSTGPTAGPTPPVQRLGSGVKAVMTNVPGAALSAVPGLPGVAFQPGTDTNHFDRIYGHPGGHWILTALADLPMARDECLILDGQLVMMEGDPAPWTGSDNCGTIDQRCAVNAAGDFAFATNTSSSTNDDYIATYVGGVWSYAAREGDLVPGLGGATLDDVIDSPVLLDDGRAGYAADRIDGVASTAVDDVLVLGATVLMQKGVTVPPGQASMGTAAIENFDLGDFWTSGDGAHWLVQGDLDAPSGRDDVVIVDGVVVLQEGSPVAGSGFAEPVDRSGIFGVSMSASGDWFARGDNDGTNQDWVVRNGSVIATVGQPIVGGTPEAWSDARVSECFFAHIGNGVGNWVVGGMTDETDEGRDAVLVLDGTDVVARESDAVDLDGNGLFDDGVFIDAFGDDDLFLQDDGLLLAVVTIKDSAGLRVGQALIEVETGSAFGTPYCTAATNSTGAAGIITPTGNPVVSANALGFRVSDLPPQTSAVLLASTARGLIPTYNGTAGTLCLGGSVVILSTPGQIVQIGAAGGASFSVDLASSVFGGGAVPGSVWNFQCWHRDRTASGILTSNMTNAIEVVLE